MCAHNCPGVPTAVSVHGSRIARLAPRTSGALPGSPSFRDDKIKLQILQHRLGVGDLELAGSLDVERLDDAVIDQHRIALRALAEPVAGGVELEIDRAGEVAAAVGE